MTEVAEPTRLDPNGVEPTSENTEGNDATSEVFLKAETGTVYKSKDDAAKGIAEKDRYIEELKAKLEQQGSQEQMLQKMTESISTAVRPTKPEVDVDELLESYATKIDEEGGKAVVGLLDEYLRVKEQQESEQIKALLSERDQKIEQLQSRLLDFDPRYQARREQIDQVQNDLGVDRETAVKFVEKYMKQPEQPERPQLPGSSETYRNGNGDAARLDAESRAALNGVLKRPLTPEEEKALVERERQRKQGRR